MLFSWCYGLKTCVPPKFICHNRNVYCDSIGRGTFGRCLGHKDGTLMNGIGDLREETLPEIPHPFHHVRIQWLSLWPGRGSSSDMSVSLAHTHSPQSEMHFSVYKLSSPWYFVIIAWADEDIWVYHCKYWALNDHPELFTYLEKQDWQNNQCPSAKWKCRPLF